MFPFHRTQGPLAYGTGPITPVVPSDLEVGDLLLMIVKTQGLENVPSLAGWTVATGTPVLSGFGGQITVLWHRWTGAPVTTGPFDSGGYQIARIHAFGGVITTGSPFDATVPAYGPANPIAVPGFTTTADDALILFVARAEETTDPNDVVGWVNADLTDFMPIVHDSNLITRGGTTLVSARRAAAGVVGATSAYQTVDGPFAVWACALIAEAPLDSGSGPETGSGGSTVSGSSLETGSGSSFEDDIPTEVTDPGYGIGTWQFDTPEPVEADRDPIDWYLAWQMMDNGSESRNKMITAVRVTGKLTRGKVSIHAASPGQEVDEEEIDADVTPRASITLPNSAQVTRYQRAKVKIKNLSIWTARISGSWNGRGIKDRLDELIIEGDTHGVQK